MLTFFKMSIIDLGVLSQRWMTHMCNFPSLHSFMVNFTTLMSSGTTRVTSSFRTWEAFLAMAFRVASSLGMLGVCSYSVDAGFNGSGRSCDGCNTRARCPRDVFLRDCTTSTRNSKTKMTSQTRGMIHQNDPQNVWNCGIAHKKGIQTMWKKLWFFEEKR